MPTFSALFPLLVSDDEYPTWAGIDSSNGFLFSRSTNGMKFTQHYPYHKVGMWWNNTGVTGVKLI